jgi:GxxExxY protein
LRVGTAKALDPKLSEISRDVVDCAYQVHSKLGPGLLESVYRECLVYEIKRRGLRVDLELDVPIIYDGHPLTSQLRLDLLIEGELIVELKAIESVLAVHKAQITVLSASVQQASWLAAQLQCSSDQRWDLSHS